MSVDALLVENIKNLIETEKASLIEAEKKGNILLVENKCKAITSMLNNLEKLDYPNASYYKKLEIMWNKKIDEIKKNGFSSGNERNSGRQGNDNSKSNDSKKSGLIDQMEKEFSARISSLISRENYTWDQIGGLSYEKSLLKEAIFFAAASPEINVDVPTLKNILLYGPPGTGKTSLAKAVSSTLSSTFFNVPLSELVSRYVGDSERLVNSLFKEARKRSPSV
ncbi:MAG: AAA family ATPase, partial [Thermoplasmataceae archaeon]